LGKQKEGIYMIEEYRLELEASKELLMELRDSL